MTRAPFDQPRGCVGTPGRCYEAKDIPSDTREGENYAQSSDEDYGQKAVAENRSNSPDAHRFDVPRTHQAEQSVQAHAAEDRVAVYVAEVHFAGEEKAKPQAETEEERAGEITVAHYVAVYGTKWLQHGPRLPDNVVKVDVQLF